MSYIKTLHISLVAAMLALAACSAQKPHKAVHVAKPAKPQKIIEADLYVESVALGRLSADDSESLAGSLQTVKAYEAQKHSKSKNMTLVVLDYKPKSGGSEQQAIAPATNGKSDYPLLYPVIMKLNSLQVTLQNIHLVSISIAPDKSTIIPEDPAQAATFFEQQQAHLLEQSTALPIEDDIRTQLSLMDFFTRHRCQDAAYLLLDNIKRSLANAAQHQTINDESLKNLSATLSAQESTLKTDLPYRF